jgi:hypothetical protein
VKYFAWDDAKNAKLKANRGIKFEDVVFTLSMATCSTSWNTRIPTGTPTSATQLSAATLDSAILPLVLRPAGRRASTYYGAGKPSRVQRSSKSCNAAAAM